MSLAAQARENGGGMTVVGDDLSQSLYRFRGATVDLFQDFPARATAEIKLPTAAIFLEENYRSTDAIVDHYNAFSLLDPHFQAARVANKPPTKRAREVAHNPPILGMFRDDVATLASDLANFIDGVFQGGGSNFLTGRGSSAMRMVVRVTASC